MDQLELRFFPLHSGEVRSMARRLMIDDGLLPALEAKEGQLQEALDKLSPDVRRATTRRFRKARRLAARKWRKANPGLPVATKAYKDSLVYEYYLDRAKQVVEYGHEHSNQSS